MMKQTMLIATLMVVTVVELVSTLNTAQNANVLEEKLVMVLIILWLEMDIAKMKPTMLNAIMMDLIVVEQLSLRKIVWNVLATVCVSA